MAGKKTSLLKKMFQGDPDELKLAPDVTVRVVPVHDLDDNVEHIIHVPTANYQGRWINLFCGMDTHNSCPFCDDPRDELKRTTVKSIMLFWNLDQKKIQWMKLPKSIAKVLVNWELSTRRGIKGREIVLNRTGSGFKNTRYGASTLDASTELPEWSEVEAEFNRVLAKVEEMMATPSLDELRRIHSGAQIKLYNTPQFQPSQTPTTEGEQTSGWGAAPTRNAVVSEEDW
jgi:hypothetical protein